MFLAAVDGKVRIKMPKVFALSHACSLYIIYVTFICAVIIRALEIFFFYIERSPWLKTVCKSLKNAATITKDNTIPYQCNSWTWT